MPNREEGTTQPDQIRGVTVTGTTVISGTVGISGGVSITGGTLGVTGTFWQATQPTSMTGFLDDIDRAVESGQIYRHSSKHSAVGTGTSIDHLLVTPASPAVRLYGFEIEVTGGPCDIYIYEAITTSADGVAAALLNADRTSVSSASSAMYEGPTVTATGTEFAYKLIPGTKQDGSIAKNGGGHVLLNASTKYLFRVTNNSGSNQTMGISIKIREGA